MNNAKTLIKVFHKHKSYTGINIFGLSVGLAFFMVIVLLLRFDLNFDKHWEKSDQIFRIDSRFIQENSVDQLALSSKLLPERINELLPEVTGFARFSRPRRSSVKIGGKLFNEDHILYGDQENLALFPLQFIAGNPAEALIEPQSVIISDELADKWFDEGHNILNEVVLIRSKYYSIKGVFKAIPNNSHLKFDALMSYSSILDKYTDMNLTEYNENIWVPDAYCYIRLNTTETEEISQKIQQFIDSDILPIIAASGSSERLEPLLISLEETHFYQGSDFDQAKGNFAFIKTTGIIGIVILLIISINYSNLSMSILVQRNKELGMRRLLGASRYQLIWKILFESLFSVVLGFVLAVLWVYLIDQSVSLGQLTGREVEFTNIFHLENTLIWIASLFLIVILSSLYPALVFSKASIIAVKEGKREGKLMTNLMIGTQFIASFMVISSMLLMKSQLSMINAFDLGITEDPIISIETGETSSPEKINFIKGELTHEPGIERITDAIVRGEELVGVYHVNAQVKDKKDLLIETAFSAGFVGQDYCSVFDIDLLVGRDFDQNVIESNSVLVNQRFANRYYRGDAIGRPIYFRDNLYNIIGVVENFHYQSLRQDLEPMALFPKHVFVNDIQAPLATSFQIRLDDNNQERALKNISQVFAKSYPNFPFNYQFISDKTKSYYADDEKNATLTAILGFSAIIIAIFGLVGLVSFEINQRQKEIGIRKILGARPETLFLVISKKQFFLLLTACLMSIPATYYFIADWLNDFTYSIDLSSSLILTTLFSFFIVLLLVLVAMSLKFIEVLHINPVETLRHD